MNTKKTYTERNKLLEKEGFLTYKQFLKSDIWFSLKRKVKKYIKTFTIKNNVFL